jgi:hypothetical protein
VLPILAAAALYTKSPATRGLGIDAEDWIPTDSAIDRLPRHEDNVDMTFRSCHKSKAGIDVLA